MHTAFTGLSYGACSACVLVQFLRGLVKSSGDIAAGIRESVCVRVISGMVSFLCG